MCSSPVSTASTFDANLLQQTFDNAIEETCRSFGLFSPFQDRERRDDLGKSGKDGASPVGVETSPVGDLTSGAPTAEPNDGMTYEGILHNERQKKFPRSYYHVEEMNKGPVDYALRLAQVPSQYQLESLSEMYVCDFPKLCKSLKRYGEEMDLGDIAVYPNSQSNYLSFGLAQESPPGPTAVEMGEVLSEYVTEMLY
ncbi:hypothetical protein V3C99_010647 [Haemonchus contortus]